MMHLSNPLIRASPLGNLFGSDKREYFLTKIFTWKSEVYICRRVVTKY